MKSVRRLGAFLMVILIYGTCIAAGYYWLSQWVRFRDVADWPSVEARMVGQKGGRFSYRSESREGARTGIVDATFVTFEYTVDGRTYPGHLATPDGGGLPLNPFGEPWRAFYKPETPELAVLSPTPYEGTGWLMTALVSGMLVVIHLCFTVPDLVLRFRLWRAVRK